MPARASNLTNYVLQVAIKQAERTQRQFAQVHGFNEIRISEIINRTHHPATDEEKRRIARALKQSVAALFPPVSAASDRRSVRGNGRALTAKELR
jgi:hypothetical protein